VIAAFVRFRRFLAKTVRGAHAGPVAETALLGAARALAADPDGRPMEFPPAIVLLARFLLTGRGHDDAAGLPHRDWRMAEAVFRATPPEALVTALAARSSPEAIRDRHARLCGLHVWTPAGLSALGA
jgi:hypothetical protein